jgi:hypothetical protein
MTKYLAAAVATMALAAALPALADATTFAGSCDLTGAVTSDDAFIDGIVQEQIEQAGTCAGSLDGGPLRSHQVTYSESLHGLGGPAGLPVIGHGDGVLVFGGSGEQLSLGFEHATVATVVRGSKSGSGAALIVPHAGGIKTELLSLDRFAG